MTYKDAERTALLEIDEVKKFAFFGVFFTFIPNRFHKIFTTLAGFRGDHCHIDGNCRGADAVYVHAKRAVLHPRRALFLHLQGKQPTGRVSNGIHSYSIPPLDPPRSRRSREGEATDPEHVLLLRGRSRRTCWPPRTRRITRYHNVAREFLLQETTVDLECPASPDPTLLTPRRLPQLLTIALTVPLVRPALRAPRVRRAPPDSPALSETRELTATPEPPESPDLRAHRVLEATMAPPGSLESPER